jgi:hypothetical protein
MPSAFPLSPCLSIQCSHVGHEREPVLIIDDLLAHPEALVDYAARSRFEPAYGPAGGYPGLRAPAPLDYVGDVVRAVVAPIVEAFGLGAAKPTRAECNFSLATLAPETLASSQRAPHIDTVNPRQFAILHYLCPPHFGGTRFFRHRASGFETLSAARLQEYERARAAETDEAGYVGVESRWFEAVGSVAAAFNRLVIYRSFLLHSGVIPDASALSPDPREGRLTANIFLTLRLLA